MATTNRERVGLALELLKNGLGPYISREFIARHKGSAKAELERIFDRHHDQRRIFSQGEPNRPFHHMDVTDLLRVMWISWNDVFIFDAGPDGTQSRERIAGVSQRVGTPGTVLR